MAKKEDSGGGGGKGQKGSIGNILKGIFKMKDSKDKKESPRRSKSETAKSTAEVDFGIETTEVLTNYRKPKGPENRRRPRTRMVKSMANMTPASSEDVAPVKENGEAGGGEAASGGAKRPILLPPSGVAMPMLAPSKTPPRERSPSPASKQTPPPPPTNSKPAAKQSPPPPPPTNSKPAPSQSDNRPLSKSESMKRQSQSVPNLNEEDESEVPKFRDAASKQKGKKKGKRRSKSIWNLFSPSKEKEKERRTEPLVTEKFLALTEEGKEEEVDANSSIHGSLEDIKEESEITGEKETEDADEHSEESLVEKRERIGKLLRATSLQPPEGSGKALHNYREIIRASRNSMPEGPAAAMH